MKNKTIAATITIPEISDEDIYLPMEEFSGYVDITQEDFKEIYLHTFHWHGETFDIHLGAGHLARSEACENQAFSYGERIIGLQYHLESTRASVEALIKNCAHELVVAKHIQTEKEMLSDKSKFGNINFQMERLLNYLETSTG